MTNSEQLNTSRAFAIREIFNKLKETKIASEELFWLASQEQMSGVYENFENSFPQSTEQCHCELPWQDYLKHFYCPCLDAIEGVENYKNILLTIIERCKIIFDNYKNEVIIQIERELREKLPPNGEGIENSAQFGNWREQLCSKDKRREIEWFKNLLFNLAGDLKRINDEHEERKRNLQAEREEHQREMQEIERQGRETLRRKLEEINGERMQHNRDYEAEAENWRRQAEENIRQAEARAREEAQRQVQGQRQEGNQSTSDREEASSETEETRNKNPSAGMNEADGKLSQDVKAHLEKTNEYLNSLDKNESNQKSKKNQLVEKSEQGTIKKKRDDGEQIQGFGSFDNTNLGSCQSNNNLKNTNKNSGEDYSLPEFKTIESQAEAKKPTLLIIGLILIVGSVLAIGYFLGKKNLKNSAK